jgi:drug efflux transport system permease protein
MRRILALVKKESYQALRDPSVLLIAFVLPPALMFLFAFAVSLDVDNVDVGVVLEGDGVQAQALAAAFDATPYLRVSFGRNRAEFEDRLVSGELKAYAVIPADFETRLQAGGEEAAIQIITDASNPNSANFTGTYLQGVFSGWLMGASTSATATAERIQLVPRFWFNPELLSNRMLIPGSMSIVMTLIGTLLTALVVSREWERGTMEALLATPISLGEIIVSKLLPYFVLGAIAALGCAFLAIQVLNVPLRGSVFALVLINVAFMIPALGQGLLISTLAKNQFLATLLAVLTGFLPATLLSGFLFEIQSMPWLIQQVTRIIPARYYVSSLQTVYLAGDVWPLFLRDMAAMLTVGGVFLGITRMKSRETLD